MSKQFERIFKIHPAYDKRHPDPKKNCGVHGVEMLFILKGSKGAVQFLLYTNWHLPHVAAETEERTISRTFAGGREELRTHLHCFYSPNAVDRGYHSPVPRYAEQKPISEPCEYLDGKPCYYDGSSLNAHIVFDAMLREGDEGLWHELEYYYHDVFEVPTSQRTIAGAELGVIVTGLCGGDISDPPEASA